MIAPVVPKAAHEHALTRVRMPSAAMRVLLAVYRKCDWATGLCSWTLPGKRLRWLTGLCDRTVQRALAWLRRERWLRVTGVCPKTRGHFYGLDTPRAWQIRQGGTSEGAGGVDEAAHELVPGARDVDPMVAPAQGWAGRFAGWVKGVVGVKPEEVRDGELGPRGHGEQGAAAGRGDRLDERRLDHAGVEARVEDLRFDRASGGGVRAWADRLDDLSPPRRGARDPRLDDSGAAHALDRVVVPFTGGHGPTPTLMLRPSFDAAPAYVAPPPGILVPVECGARSRGGAPVRAGAALGPGWLDPGPDPHVLRSLNTSRPAAGQAARAYARHPSRGEVPEGRDGAASFDDFAESYHGVADMTEPPLDLEADPVPGAWDAPRLYTRDELAELNDTPSHMRPPDGPRGPGDAAPHRRIELAYRQAFFAAFGVHPIVAPKDHRHIKTLLDNLGLDRVLAAIRDTIVPGRYTQTTIQQLAMHWPKYR